METNISPVFKLIMRLSCKIKLTHRSVDKKNVRNAGDFLPG